MQREVAPINGPKYPLGGFLFSLVGHQVRIEDRRCLVDGELGVTTQTGGYYIKHKSGANGQCPRFVEEDVRGIKMTPGTDGNVCATIYLTPIP
jgi:hypothetical protein